MAKNSKLKTVLSVIAVVLAVVLIGGLFIYTKLSDSGFFLRHTISVKSENFQVNNAEMSYFFSTNYSTSITNNSSYYEYYGLDTSVALDEQQYPGGGSWYDYFLQDVTVNAVKQLLILCEAAKAAGYELTEEDNASIEEAIANIETRAKDSGYTTSYYVMSYYGPGVQLKDVRSAMELSQLAYSYYDHVMASYQFTEDDWNTYFDENEDNFQNVDYLSYTFSVEDIAHLNEDEEADETEAATETDATETETEAASETEAQTVATETVDDASATEDSTETEAPDETEAEEESDEHDHSAVTPIVEGYANELASKTTAEDFYAYLETFLNDVMYASEEDEAAREESIAEDLDEVESTGVVYSADDETLVELFKLGENETYIEVNEEDDEYTVYLITKPKYIEDYVTKDARMIILTGTSDEVTADLDEINKALTEDSSVEKFIELAKEYSADSGAAHEGALYENISKEDYSSETLMDWLFSEERKAGDMDIFSTTEDEEAVTSTSSTVYYFVARYEGDGMIKWQYDANEALRTDKYNEDYAAFEEAHGGDKISVSLEDLYKIPN